MRKFFYGISIFAFLSLLSLGYYRSYLSTEQKLLEVIPEYQSEGTSPDSDILNSRTVSLQNDSGYGVYYLKETDGYAFVYENDKSTLYEPTGIAVDALPEPLQTEIREGKFLKTQEELYSFLENYSS